MEDIEKKPWDNQAQVEADIPAAQDNPAGNSAGANSGTGAGTQATQTPSVDGDKLGEALRRVIPFMHETVQDLKSVLMEVYPDRTEFTACDGFRLVHLTIKEAVGLDEGEYLLEGDGVKDFSQRHYNGQRVPVMLQKSTGKTWDEQLVLGEVTIPILQSDYPDYKGLVPADLDNIAIITTKEWIKALRASKSQTVGVLFSPGGCKMYFTSPGGEPGMAQVPVQMYAGQEKKVVYNVERLRKALSTCGSSATIKVPTADEVNKKVQPTCLEGDNIWLLIVRDSAEFPKVVEMNQGERELLKWGVEALNSVLAGEVQGKVVVGGGKFYLEIGAHIARTEVVMEAPEMARKEVAVV